MIRVLSFDNEDKASKITYSIPEDLSETFRTKLRWISMRISDDIASTLPDVMQRSEGFLEDLLEDQRPRYQVLPTLEDNDDIYRIIVIKLPTADIFTDDEHELQLTIILLGETIITITNRDQEYISSIMNHIILIGHHPMNMQRVLAILLDKVIENAIRVVEKVEDRIEELENAQFYGRGLNKGFLQKVVDLKGRVFQSYKDTRATQEMITEMLDDEEFLSPEFEHVEDRLLFLADEVENQKDALKDVIDIHISLSSHRLDQRLYWFSIIGSILIIPTIISGFFGMNVDLPPLNFGEIILLNLGLIAIAFGILYLLFHKDT